MPFDGQPSRGCRECRERRVKCDQTAPACRRCCRAGRICPGYEPRVDVIFRDMNYVAETKVMKRMRRMKWTRCLAPPGQPPSPGRLGLAQAAEEKLQHDIRFLCRSEPYEEPGWEEMALTRFFADYTALSDDSADGLRFIPGLCRRAKEDHLLKESLRAVAFRSQGNQCQMDWMIAQGRLAYGRALLLLAQVLEDGTTSDSVLAAVYLLGLYEIASGEDDLNKLFPFNHSHGRSHLLKLRANQQVGNAIQKSLFRTSFTLMIVTSIITPSQPPNEAEAWLALSGMDKVRYRHSSLNLRLARLCAEAQTLFDSTTRDEEWVLELMKIFKAAVVLESDYDGWSESTYEIWPYHKIRLLSGQVKSSGGEPATTQPTSPHIYHDIWVAFVWNMHRSCRIHLHEVLLHCMDLLYAHPRALSLSIDPQATRDQCKSTVTDLLSDICDSVPFCIGDIDSTGTLCDDAKKLPLAGYLLVWPLYVASVSVEAGSCRDVWIREKLRYISSAMGLRKAELLALRPRKEPWDLS